ncbi:MAG: cupin fold metalloprotein, WbuC family [Chloroflexi bacterium]|nr:cupin fold metalloprotein, WbuC family [Chloroflexota bacterium]MDL1884814.1 cupin fold metalloprotein, WbuC family [Anaerolineae bacterium CFX8]
MRPITQQLIDSLIAQAAESPRRRVPYNFHRYDEPVQRMINAILPGSYITPHKHENPDKVELIAPLVGRAALVHFSDSGDVQQIFILDPNGSTRGVDIPPRVYHNFVALTPCAVLEIIQGPYHPDTHKQFAPWAPHEGTPEAVAYLRGLEEQITAQLI